MEGTLIKNRREKTFLPLIEGKYVSCLELVPPCQYAAETILPLNKMVKSEEAKMILAGLLKRSRYL